MKREPITLWEGECAYALQTGAMYEIMVHSSNHVVHVKAGETHEADRAERVVRGLNAYPGQTRRAYGLL